MEKSQLETPKGIVIAHAKQLAGFFFVSWLVMNTAGAIHDEWPPFPAFGHVTCINITGLLVILRYGFPGATNDWWGLLK